MNGTLLKPMRFAGCKFREIEEDGSKRCHFGPPQRSAIIVAGPGGQTIMQETVGFPQVLDDWSCH